MMISADAVDADVADGVDADDDDQVSLARMKPMTMKTWKRMIGITSRDYEYAEYRLRRVARVAIRSMASEIKETSKQIIDIKRLVSRISK